MIFWRKEKPKLVPGEKRWRDHFCLFPVVTERAVFWFCEIVFIEEYYYDPSFGSFYWKKKKVRYYDKERHEHVTIPY